MVLLVGEVRSFGKSVHSGMFGLLHEAKVKSEVRSDVKAPLLDSDVDKEEDREPRCHIPDAVNSYNDPH